MRLLGNCSRHCSTSCIPVVVRPRHTVHPVHKIQWLKYDMCGAIAPGCFQLITHLTIARCWSQALIFVLSSNYWDIAI
jgi:hypothetical protein